MVPSSGRHWQNVKLKKKKKTNIQNDSIHDRVKEEEAVEEEEKGEEEDRGRGGATPAPPGGFNRQLQRGACRGLGGVANI